MKAPTMTKPIEEILAPMDQEIARRIKKVSAFSASPREPMKLNQAETKVGCEEIGCPLPSHCFHSGTSARQCCPGSEHEHGAGLLVDRA